MYKLILIFLIVSASGNAQVGEEWKRFYNGPGFVNDEARKVVADDNGNSFVAGHVGSEIHVNLIKYDVSGNQIWNKTYTQPGSNSEYVVDMKKDNLDNLIIVAYATGDSTSDILTLKVDPVSGNEIWRANTNTPFSSEFPYSMCIDNSGNICITGRISESGNYDMITLRYSSSGNVLFNRRFNGSLSLDDIGLAVTTDNSRNVYVAGYANYSGSNSDYILIKYGPSGNTIWGRYYGNGNNQFDYAVSVLVDNSDNVIVSGNTDTYQNRDITTLKFTSDGNMIWNRTYSKSQLSGDNAAGMKLDDRNNIYISYRSYDTIPYHNIIKYDSSGTQLLVFENSYVEYNTKFFFTLDDFDNLYSVSARDTTLNKFDSSYRYLSITKFNSTGSLIYDSIYGNGESIVLLTDVFFGNSGKIYIAGNTTSYGDYTGNDFLSSAYDLSGNFYWENVIRGPGTGNDDAVSLFLKNGSVYVTGTGSFGFYKKFTTLKYNNAGELIWQQILNRYPGSNDVMKASAIDDNYNIIETGYTTISGNNQDLVTVKYDSNGVLKWFKEYGGSSNGIDQANAVTYDAGGNVYIAGTVTNSPGGVDWLLLKYDPDGNQIYDSYYNGSASGSDNANDIALGIENEVYVCGTSYEPSTGTDATLIKYDNSGNQVWIKKITGNGIFTDQFNKIKIDVSGNIYVSGSIYSDVNRDDYLIVKYDRDGNQLWQRTYNGTGNNSDKVNDMTLYNDKVIVTGESLGTGTLLDYMTIEYDSSGNQLWTARYNGSLNRSDKANAVTTDIMGNVYVTGESTIAISNVDIVTIKYDPQGDQQYILQYSGTANINDIPSDIAVGEKDEIYICGSTYLTSNNTDMVVLKYSKSVGINEPLINLPKEFLLYDNYPNPFNPVTKIQFDMPVDSKVELKIYDITGKEVRSLINEYRQAGHYTVSFDGTDLSSGVFIYRLRSGEFVKSKKMFLIK